MTEIEALDLLLERYAEDLQERTRRAFEGMVGRPLSEKQRRWVFGVAENFGICIAPSQNLFSAMPETKRRENLKQVKTLLPWERGLQKRPLKPPGR